MSRKMKDSGIEWIGEIPGNWSLTKIGSIYYERNTKVSDKEYKPLSVTKLGIVPQLDTAAKTDDGDNRKLVKINDFVINSRSDRRGSCGISQYEGSVSLINIVLEPRSDMNNLYYNYLFKSENFADEFYRWGNGIVDDLWSTKWTNMKRIYVPYPNIEEQTHIAAFLDNKCTKIDETIEKQRHMIEKLKVYKQSVITETVTKGMKPDVPMKKSGVEWIGEIPEHWSMVRLGRLITSTMNGLTRRAKEEIISGQIVLRIKEISDGKIDYIDANRIELTDTESNLYSLKDGDLLFVRVNGSKNLVGKSVVFKMINEPVAYNDHIIKVSLSNDVIPDYLQLYMQSYSGKAEIEQYVNTAAGQYSISGTGIRSLCFPLPPKEEQEALYGYVYKNSIKIDNIIAQKEALIEKLTEYKKSLIYECVTGKREV